MTFRQIILGLVLLSVAVVVQSNERQFSSNEIPRPPSRPRHPNQRSLIGNIHNFFNPTTVQPAPRPFEPLPPDYEYRNADGKQHFLWKRIEQTVYPRGELPTTPTPNKTNLLQPDFDIQTFTHVSDEMPEGRQKLTHEYGVVGKVQLQMFRNSPYTGVFESPGAPYCLARLSATIPNDPKYIAPSIAVKVLVDAKPSLSFHSFNTLEGQPLPDRNFFRKTLTNVVPDPFEPQIVGLQRVFNHALTLLPPSPDRPESATLLGLYEQASINTHGDRVENVVAPWKIEWVPNPELTAAYENRTEDFRIPLMEIPENTVLYDIVLYRQKDRTGEFVGRLITRSRFLASRYGDEMLFFQHASKRWQA